VAHLLLNPGAFVLYVIVATVTPGPNNLMLMNVGLLKGHGAAARTGIGVSSGWGFQVLLCGLGIGGLVHAVPGLASGIDVAGLCYLTWLSWKLWSSDHLSSAAPMHGMGGAFLYQWINPKAISMSLTTAGLFVVKSHGGFPIASAFAVALGATILCIPSTLVWGLSGVALRDRLAVPSFARAFNRAAALTLVVMVLWLALTTW